MMESVRPKFQSAIGVAMAVEAATFWTAAGLHFAAGITDAAVPETIIGLVMAAGSVAVLARRAGAWRAALTTHVLAIVGVLVGISTIASGIGPQTAPDIAYHVSILVALAVGLVLLSRPQGRAAFGR